MVVSDYSRKLYDEQMHQAVSATRRFPDEVEIALREGTTGKDVRHELS